MTAYDLRGVSTAVFGSGASGRADLTEWDAAIRGGLSTARRIGVLSLATGVGTSTIAHHVTRAVAARRSQPILAVDVSAGASGLAARLGAAPVGPEEARADARTSAEATTGLEERDRVVALRPRDVSDPVAAWLREAAPITRFFDVSVTDFGARHPVVDLAACAAMSDVVCVVADAGRSPAEHARSVLPAIAGLPESPRVVLALIDHDRRGDAVARALRNGTHPVVAVPFDRGLRSGGHPRSSSARLALVRLTADLVDADRRAA